MEDYRTIRGTATGEYEEKKSRFIAQLSFADSEEAAVAFLEQVRAANRTARHNVYAYRLRAGNRERYSDDGEPAKTAGTPALEVLQHSGLTDLCRAATCLVERWGCCRWARTLRCALRIASTGFGFHAALFLGFVLHSTLL